MRALILLSALLISAPALAQSRVACADLYKLKELVRTCAFNIAFVKAADACNASMDREAAARSAALAAALERNGRNASSAQAAELGAQASNLDSSTTALEALRAEAVSANQQLKAYLANFLRPGGISPELAARLHAPFLGWLEQFGCYRTNKDALTKYIGMMDGKIAKLDQTLETVSGLAGRTGKALRTVGSGSASNLKEAAHAHAAGESPGGSRTPASSSSSITGVEEDSAKRAKSR